VTAQPDEPVAAEVNALDVDTLDVRINSPGGSVYDGIFSGKDLGIGYLAGEGDDPQITRTFYVDSPAAEAVVVRARAAREAAGTLSGHCLGEQLE
jgi:hypothetical protein